LLYFLHCLKTISKNTLPINLFNFLQPKTMKKNRITDLQTLRFEKQRLQDACLQKEVELNQSFQYIQDNVGGILIKSIFLKSDSAKEKFDFVHEMVGTSFDTIIEIATNKENRTENMKTLGKNIVTSLLSRVIK
jgi:hypothetical protein